jgi:ABC-type multidrug transport system ATPase subunit
VSRLFFTNADAPVAAVNNVSLGVKEGSLFGFFGANGAGKSTLIKMITGEIPTSAGVIEIMGQPSGSCPGLISSCPQFNDHLTDEMTVDEHLKLFSMIFGVDNDGEISEQLIADLDLTEHRSKPVKELSGGNARKVALAIALLAPSRVVLLDEPTSSLDPMIRRKVHQLINAERGRRTFLLCTHLLGEAEDLCDTISIMIRGSIFTVGAPQELADTYGRDWRLETLLVDDSRETEDKVHAFVMERFARAWLETGRPHNRTYAIPVEDAEIADVFRAMKQAVTDDVGVRFFTCSASTLEKVFLELVSRSEEMGVEPGEALNESLSIVSPH